MASPPRIRATPSAGVAGSLIVGIACVAADALALIPGATPLLHAASLVSLLAALGCYLVERSATHSRMLEYGARCVADEDLIAGCLVQRRRRLVVIRWIGLLALVLPFAGIALALWRGIPLSLWQLVILEGVCLVVALLVWWTLYAASRSVQRASVSEAIRATSRIAADAFRDAA